MIVQKLRLRKGWSQEQLADLSGLSVRTIQRIERGHTASIESLKALGAAFDVDFSTLRNPDMSTSSTAPTTSTASTEEMLAFAHVRRIKGFYLHVAQFVIVMGLLTLLSFFFLRGDHAWLLLVACGWGSGLAVHGLKAFGAIPVFTAHWEKRMVEAHLDRKL